MTTTPGQRAPERTSDFIAGMGVNTHIPYTDGGYANLQNVRADLAYVGLSNVRDGITNGQYGSALLSSYTTLAQEGVKFTFGVDSGLVHTSSDLQSYLGLIDQVAQAAPGAVVAVEGPNEVNNWPVTYNGVTGLQGALNLQRDIYALVHSDPNLVGVAVDYFTGWPASGGPDPSNTPGLADYDNQHPYPEGAPPATPTDPSYALLNEARPGATVYTETGYSTTSAGGWVGGPVSPAAQASYLLDLYMDTAKDGVAETYVYQLMDAYEPDSPQTDDGFGLFDYTGAPKPAATAIHNLTATLADTGVVAASFAPSSLNYSISGLPSSGGSLLLEKSGGAFDLVTWNEETVWDVGTQTAVAPSPVMVLVGLGKSYQTVQVFDPLAGTSPISTLHDLNQISLTLTDHPLIVEVEPDPPTAALEAAPDPAASPGTDSAASPSATPGTDSAAVPPATPADSAPSPASAGTDPAAAPPTSPATDSGALPPASPATDSGALPPASPATDSGALPPASPATDSGALPPASPATDSGALPPASPATDSGALPPASPATDSGALPPASPATDSGALPPASPATDSGALPPASPATDSGALPPASPATDSGALPPASPATDSGALPPASPATDSGALPPASPATDSGALPPASPATDSGALPPASPATDSGALPPASPATDSGALPPASPATDAAAPSPANPAAPSSANPAGNLPITSTTVYRFLATGDGEHFYTANAAERDALLAGRPDLHYEGIGMNAADPGSDTAAVPVYRFLDTVNGFHFFTSSVQERDTLFTTRSDLHYEGVGFYEHTTQQAGDTPVYRFLDIQNGSHFYTTSASEQAAVLATRTDMRYEGVAFYAPTTS